MLMHAHHRTCTAGLGRIEQCHRIQSRHRIAPRQHFAVQSVYRRIHRSRSTLLRTATVCSSGQMPKKTGVLFVCLGNICRSPTAEAVFRAVVDKADRKEHFNIDSCGTGGGNPDWYKEKGWAYHEGHESDRRMQAAATKRGVCLTSLSRPLRPQDLLIFDYILGMDHENIAAIQIAADHWASQGQDVPQDYRSKVHLMCKYLDKQGPYSGIMEVPDPYYGGAKGFELVLDMLEDACEGLLQHIQEHDFTPASF